jgi:hypothetical protein
VLLTHYFFNGIFKGYIYIDFNHLYCPNRIVPDDLSQVLVLELLIDDLKTAPEPERTLGKIDHLLLDKLSQRLLDGYRLNLANILLVLTHDIRP